MSKTVEKMRKAHEKQAKLIRKNPAFNEVSEAFDVEYAVAKELHKARTKAQLSQAQVAEKMGTTQSVISRIERGGNVSVETLARYAAACGGTLKVKVV
ncbi:helix-turn-helix transcriptional regulator [Pontiellaceae bacterium B12227]|nr:helix-turn-helix transcriptional regulator [Pontiellaceae bacterium B12227]